MTDLKPDENRKAKHPNLTGKGRPKGVPNKTTAALKDMILASLDKAGGIDYLVKLSAANPAAYASLVGKVLPLQVNGEHNHNVKAALQWLPTQ